MLSHCLIFLCIGVYASCMPAHQPMLQETLQSLNKLKEETIVKPKNESMQSVEIPITLEKECALYNLDKFIQALQLLKTEDSENTYANIHNTLKALAGNKAINEILKSENENNCEISTMNINKLLKEFIAFLTELNLLLESYKGTE